MELKDIYNQLILDNYKNPYKKGVNLKDSYSVSSTNNNCGDSVSLYFSIDDSNNRIKQVSFEAEGCVICQASASVLMRTVEGRQLQSALEIIDNLKQLLSEGVIPESSLDNEGERDEKSEYRALSYINAFPTRKQCVLLSWEALEKKLNDFMV